MSQPFDFVITVCDDANEAGPVLPGVKNRLRWSLADPSRATGEEQERLAIFRRVRNEIRGRIEAEILPSGQNLLNRRRTPFP